ncbi:MAG TPA: hypothetical protein VJ742_12420 [Nitrososphaera sp.]|nr:hypothetical protein [Nitrososphaera sp.]
MIGKGLLKTVQQLRHNASSLRKAAGTLIEEGSEVGPLYHGTSVPWISHQVGPITQGLATDNLFGPGLYMTGNKDIAGLGYALGKGRGSDSTRYSLAWKQKPNLIDLEKPLPTDVHDLFLRHARGTSYNAMSTLPGKEVYADWHIGAKLGGVAEQIKLTQQLRERGYHGFRHVGGGIATNSEVRHEVNIAFAPERDIQVLGHRSMMPEKLTANIDYNRQQLSSWQTAMKEEGIDIPAVDEHGHKQAWALHKEDLDRDVPVRANILRSRVYSNVARSMEVRAARTEASSRRLTQSMNTGVRHSSARRGLPVRSSATGVFR